MKVLKFGGTSVGTTTAIRNVKHIVENTPQPVVVVVSALGGVTDQLIRLTQVAAKGDTSYMAEFDALTERHHQMVADVIVAEKQALLISQLDALLGELRSILHGVCLIQDLTPKTADAIVAYGERLSSLIVANLIEGAQYIDSRRLVKTELRNGKHLVDFDLTNKLVVENLGGCTSVVVIGGFIASDRTSGITTNLGRGGSDYTAAIVAAALQAEALEIWTDVDGFMTADPRIIPGAFTIDELSYAEAMELCNFGAKVIYPPTIYPVCQKNIPIFVKNTFRPEARGSVIRKDAAPSGRDRKSVV